MKPTSHTSSIYTAISALDFYNRNKMLQVKLESTRKRHVRKTDPGSVSREAGQSRLNLTSESRVSSPLAECLSIYTQSLI